MNAKLLTVASLAIICAGANTNAQSTATDIITLDLSKATTELMFDATNGMWTGTYDDDETEIESQVFSFVHSSMGDYNTWWGFTASNSANNAKQTNTMTFQFSNMGLGGIVLNDDGTVKTNSYGAPVTSAQMPYLVGFAMTGFAKHPADMTFNTDKNYEVIGAYFNLNSYTYYSIEDGDSFSRAFNNGDKFTLIVHGITPQEEENTVEVELASYANGNLTINRGWTYVDLSALGTVNQIWFSMTSTDSGAYGMNTPAYFCMDKLMVRESSQDSAAEIAARRTHIAYDRTTRNITLTGETFAMVYDQAGRVVMTSDTPTFSIAHLEAGVYIVKSGDAKLKIAR